MRGLEALRDLWERRTPFLILDSSNRLSLSPATKYGGQFGAFCVSFVSPSDKPKQRRCAAALPTGYSRRCEPGFSVSTRRRSQRQNPNDRNHSCENHLLRCLLFLLEHHLLIIVNTTNKQENHKDRMMYFPSTILES